MIAGFTTRRVMTGAFVAQLVFAAALMGRDFAAALPHIAWPSTQPGFQSPISPGDQTRRYRPRNTPLNPSDPNGPNRPFRNTGDMPARLHFATEGTVMTLTGSINVGDAERFATAMTENPDTTAIRLNSPGGSVHDALDIGRAIRDADMVTEMGALDICLSACPYILAAGTTRTVHTESQVGVHQHAFETNSVLPAFLAVEDIQRGQGELMSYLDDMGVDTLLMQHALTTPPNEIYVLVEDQLRDYKLATEIIE